MQKIKSTIKGEKMNKIMKIMVITLALLFAGCAPFPPPAQMREEVVNFKLPKLPEAGKAIVYIIRPMSTGCITSFNVFVDDKESESEMGYTRCRQYIYFNLEPGDHKILSKAENWAEINLTAASNDIIFIRQDAYVVFLMPRNSLSKLQDYKAKYYVKHLKLGTIIKTDK